MCNLSPVVWVMLKFVYKIAILANLVYLRQIDEFCDRIIMIALKELFERVAGRGVASIVKLTGDGSNRSYYRMCAGDISLIGAVGTCAEENRAFVAMSERFLACGIDAPRVLAVSADGLCYIQEDLGDTSLFAYMKESRDGGRFLQKDADMLCKVMSLLPRIQHEVAAGLDFGVCYPTAAFDRRTVMWDFNYFKYCFLKGVGVEFNESLLEDEFEKMATLLLRDNENTFMYRDFQSRNVMIHNGRPYFIDFQGGRKGPLYYDVASFVGQARACYTPLMEQMMVDAYLNALAAYRRVDRVSFMRALTVFRVFRLLQNLGTYGFRGLYEHKKAFVETIPGALLQLKEQLAALNGEFPYLEQLVGDIIVLPMFVKEIATDLTVDVLSFSYRRGIPDDYSGNGGGFVFDCRAIHNPGRYEPYKKLCGTDAPVIEFLETQSEMPAFLENAYALVDNMVDTYKKRGFTHIQICCGCTGGQHRSVYSAEHIAHHVADKFGVRVVVTHKMLNRKYVIDAK